MKLRIVGYVLGYLVLCFGTLFLTSIPFSLYFHDGATTSFLLSFLATTIFGGTLIKSCKTSDDIGIKEGFGIVTFSWVAAAAFGALPYMLSDLNFSFTDGFFETMSGLTTTGATIFTTIEGTQPSILFYRSLTHWVGGMGIIVLSVAVLPMLGIGGMQLFKAEVPGPTADKLTPRVADTAAILWKVYVLITAIEIAFLMFGGMGFFDAICHSFATMATGGFSTKNSSVLSFNSAYFDYVMTFFMFLAGVNFTIHYKIFFHRDFSGLKDPEFKFYLGVTLLFTAIILMNVYSAQCYDSLAKCAQYSSFTVVSITTTTGFCTGDYEKWPLFSQFLLVLLMFIGGSAGSTAGGMKCIRIMLIFKALRAEFYKLIHPRAFIEIKLGNKVISKEVVRAILNFFALFLFIFAFFTALLSFLGVDLITAIGTVIATMGNIGPGLGLVGPTDNYAHFMPLIKWVCSFCMLLGRLELLTVLVLFTPEIWKK